MLMFRLTRPLAHIHPRFHNLAIPVPKAADLLPLDLYLHPV